MRLLPQATAEGLWLNAALFVNWKDIKRAEFIWRIGLPYIKLHIHSDAIFVYKKPEIPLFYRRLDGLRAEVEMYCPEEHPFREAFPSTLPDRAYRLLYYSYAALSMLISMAVIFGILWVWGDRAGI